MNTNTEAHEVANNDILNPGKIFGMLQSPLCSGTPDNQRSSGRA
jgi:hypothetical protein